MKSLSTKTTLRPLGIALKILFGAFILLCLVAPYLHILADRASDVKWFGFKNLRVFLYSIGMPLSLFGTSLIILLASRFATHFRVYLFWIGSLFNYSSIFYIIWVFWYAQDLPVWQYYMSIAVMSLCGTLVVVLFYKDYKEKISVLTNKIKYLFDYIYSLNTDNYIKNKKKKDFAIKRIEVTDFIILEENE